MPTTTFADPEPEGEDGWLSDMEIVKGWAEIMGDLPTFKEWAAYMDKGPQGGSDDK